MAYKYNKTMAKCCGLFEVRDHRRSFGITKVYCGYDSYAKF